MVNRFKTKKRFKISIMVISILTMCFFLTIGYAAFSDQFTITDFVAHVRPEINTRVSSVSTSSSYISNLDYSMKKVICSAEIPNSSSVTFTTTITTYSNVRMALSNIEVYDGNNLLTNVSITPDLTNTYIKICDSNNVCTLNASKEIDVTITNNTGSVIDTDNLNINFTFTPFYTVTYNNLVIGDALEGHNYEYTFSPVLDDVSITMNNSLLVANTDYTYSSGNLVINNVTGDIVITEVSSASGPWYELCTSTSNNLNCKLITIGTPYADNTSSTNVSSSSGINFNANSSTRNGRGLYYTVDTSKTEDLDGDGEGDRIYYYRGNVTNNFVIFDSYCWRIVRTNEDGSIKLIYGGTPSGNSCPQSGTNVNIGSGTFNSSYNNNAYVGYMYGSTSASTYANAHRNTNNSTIKTTIDNWYNTNLSDSASYLADYRFCDDRTLVSGNGYGTTTSVYAPEQRFYANNTNQIPNIKCNQDNDKFSVSTSNGNGALSYPIGLLTADEANYAGVRYSTSGTNNDSFLYTGSYFWLLSPGDLDSNGAYIFLINNSGNMRLQVAGSTSTTVYVRPVVNLLPSVAWASGNGTYNNPYTVTDGGGNTNPPVDPPVSDLWYDNCSNNANRLNCRMLSASNPTSDGSIDFSSFSGDSNGNGLYYTSNSNITEDINSDGNGERVYYYRGSVTNNFVTLGGYCWRIVRTNEDGTIRLIYGGTLSNGSCPQNGTNVNIGSSAFNSSASDNAYVGYMYGTTGSSTYDATHRNTNNSTIKTAIDSWYNSNFASNSAYLADEVFCNDRSISSGNGAGTSNTVYAPNNRLNTNKSPSLKCAQNNDKFTVSASKGNGALTNPIGLITADELSLAGTVFVTNSNTNNFYLYTGAGLWTMSPSDYYSGDFYNFYMNTTGELRIANDVTTSYPVRPVINLLDTVIVSSGSGTYNSPYRLALS